MKIAVTGATGFVGRSVVPILDEAGVELLLVGREPKRIAQRFPGTRACGYDELEQHASGFDLLVHLAVVNNDANVPPSVFHDVNVRQLLEVASAAKRAGISRFINISSIHALDPDNRSSYARSKQEARKQLAGVKGIAAISVFLPAVYGNEWSGKLAILNKLPKRLAHMLFQVLAAFKPVLHVSRLADFLLHRAAEDEGDEIILSDGQSGNLVYRGVRRIIDVCFALAVIILFWWGLILLWGLVRILSPGPGIFAQQRVGRNGAVFTCYKFRTMHVGTVQAATDQVSANSVTRLGRLLRKTKLDELPQIWNILRNEISLIGPRPCLPIQTQLIEARRRRGVLRLKPGISGLAQVNGIDMREPETLARWDARYAALQSLLLDFRIIMATASGRGQGDKVKKDH
ncbi:hybrid nucleoside-diphosphate sugar epimerase/sugar transferase [Mesorhizobium sp. Root157]|uniref:hybrid nucleoside-diphosphate sugar epimerase/sugar transferase n=1 Tax=Mesorhizobium sp. Root157 TaxID=1736477 RepID=UPI0009EBA036|nr:hybrid nucleoside-diphosphate sugar epimerase/sugar transferase [Mesorhizobium sp. Root157]